MSIQCPSCASVIAEPVAEVVFDEPAEIAELTAPVTVTDTDRVAEPAATSRSVDPSLLDRLATPEAPVYEAPPAVAPAPAAPAIDMEQLKQLGELHTAGVLSDEEFAAAKAKLLGTA